MRVAIAGTGTLGFSVLLGTHNAEHEIVAILQDGRKSKGFRRWFQPLMAGIFGAATTVTGFAKRRGIPIHFIDKMDDSELQSLRDLDIDLLLVAGFAIIMKGPLIHLPRIGTVNCHPSLLPLHRGPNPFAAVILAKRTETGVTYHAMDESIDTGDILMQESMDLDGTESAGLVYKNTSAMAGSMIADLLEQIERDGLSGTPQESAAASYEGKLEGDALFLDWDRPAEDLHRHCLACLPFAFPRFWDEDRIVYITKTTYDAEPVDDAPGTLIAVRERVAQKTKSGAEIKLRSQARIATGEGTLTLWGTLSARPIPGLWPGIFFARRFPGHVVH
jgi:methionyl-tRNA formyltransferase